MLLNLYRFMGVGLLGLMLAFNYLGMTLSQPERVVGVPKTVRQNPGTYRSHYQHTYVRVGGK